MVGTMFGGAVEPAAGVAGGVPVPATVGVTGGVAVAVGVAVGSYGGVVSQVLSVSTVELEMRNTLDLSPV